MVLLGVQALQAPVCCRRYDACQMEGVGVILASAAGLGATLTVGYLLVGVIIGPHTPGFIPDPEVAEGLGATETASDKDMVE